MPRSKRRKAFAWTAPRNAKPSPIIQFGVVFLMVAAMVLVAYAVKKFLP